LPELISVLSDAMQYYVAAKIMIERNCAEQRYSPKNYDAKKYSQGGRVNGSSRLARASFPLENSSN
jgi:hypothetical protein